MGNFSGIRAHALQLGLFLVSASAGRGLRGKNPPQGFLAYIWENGPKQQGPSKGSSTHVEGKYERKKNS